MEWYKGYALIECSFAHKIRVHRTADKQQLIARSKYVGSLITQVYGTYARIFIIVLDEMPQLHQLQHLRRNDAVVNVIRAVAPSWIKFALYLRMDRNMIDIWQRSTGPEDAARKLFSHWLDGNGRTPISWRTLIKVLYENDLPIIAIKVEEILTGHSLAGEISQQHTDKS